MRGTMAGTMAEVGEHGLLRLLHRRYGARRQHGVVRGVGDDAAVLTQVGPRAVVSTDMLIEGVDFDFAWASPRDVGHKAAAVNLSDLAAMGAKPRAMVISLALRSHDAVADVLTLVAAADAVGKRVGAAVVGGDISAIVGPLVINVTVVGECGRGRELPRAAARAGDVVLVSGRLGGAAAGLALLRGRGVPASMPASVAAGLRRRQLRPQPQLALGMALSRWGRVRACADISDGLARDALHLPRPGCGVQLDVRRLPLARGLAPLAAASRSRQTPWQLALHGGEDFELALAVAARDVTAAVSVARRCGVRLTPVGRIVRGAGLWLTDAGGVLGGGGVQGGVQGATRVDGSTAGFDHFRLRRKSLVLNT